MAQMPTERMGPPPGASPPMRMTASWSGSKRTYRIQVCGAKMRPMASSPRTVTQTGAVRRRSSKREAHLAVHRPSACSGVKALRNTSDATAASRQAALAFRSLDPFRALREPDRRRRTKNGFPAPNKERSAKPTKQPLDRKSPIQVCCKPRSRLSAQAAVASQSGCHRRDDGYQRSFAFPHRPAGLGYSELTTA